MVSGFVKFLESVRVSFFLLILYTDLCAGLCLI